ncbi:MAG TPA: hypothetical protein H9713_10915 [Candidatus Mediterraneibacter surreyensis]|mgnify:FL=1|nr:hypothetical protein [Candidatus Mediterraneibacter surreyensis]
MKKLTAILLTLIMTMAMTCTVFAAEITEEDGTPKREEVTISASIAPTYTVTIPKDIQVEFNKTSTAFGTIVLDKAQIDPGRVVKVELAASGLLKNKADDTKTIAYAINAGGTAFVSQEYTAAGQSTPLTIDITKQAWDQAYAGEYSDTVTFTISYVEASGAAANP